MSSGNCLSGKCPSEKVRVGKVGRKTVLQPANVTTGMELEPKTKYSKGNTKIKQFWHYRYSIYFQYVLDLEFLEGQILIEIPSIQLSHILEHFIQLKMISRPCCQNQTEVIKTKLLIMELYYEQEQQVIKSFCKSLLNSTYLWSSVQLAINKKQKYFSLPDHQLGENLALVFGFYEKTKNL